MTEPTVSSGNPFIQSAEVKTKEELEKIEEEKKAKEAEKAKQTIRFTSDKPAEKPAEEIDASLSTLEQEIKLRNQDKQLPCDIDKEKEVQEWREANKDKPTAQQIYDELKKQGLSDEEALEKLKEKEIARLREDTAFLKDKFEQNPDLRIKLQENFSKLSREEQKAVLNEAYSSGRKLEQKEIDRLLQGLVSSSDEVKSITIAALRNDSRVPKDALKRLEDKLNVAEDKVVNRLPKMKTTEAAAVIDNVMADKKSVCRAKLAEQLPKCDKAVIPYGVKTFTKSENIKNDEQAKEAYIKSLPKYDDKNQVIAAKAGIDSDNFNSKNRDGIITEIKNFKNKENQATVANYVSDSDKTDSDNRITMAKEIKNLNSDVQASVAKHFSENEKNQADDKVMKTLSNEVSQMKIKESEKAELQKTIERQRMAEAEAEATRQRKEAEKAEAERREALVRAEKEAEQKAIEQAKAEQKMLNEVIKEPQLAALVQQAMMKNSAKSDEKPTYVTLANYINSGKISLATIKAAGYENVSIRCIYELSAPKQDELVSSVELNKLLYMYHNGLLPSRVQGLVIKRISSGSVDSGTVRKAAANVDSADEIIELYQNQSSGKSQEVCKEVLKHRFEKRYNEMFGEDNGNGFNSIA